MTSAMKRNLLGVLVDAIQEDEAVRRILNAAQERVPFGATALAVHGVMTGVSDDAHRARLNSLDLVVPDGQPVRWALNLLHGTALGERVYGPDLMLAVCRAAEAEGIGIYLYGSTPQVLAPLIENLRERFPYLEITGAEPSKFAQLNAAEKAETIERIQASGAGITFVGLGCPRQEVWTYEYRQALEMPVLAVGAAFDFHARMKSQAPVWMRDHGLEWLFRLVHEPRRLWKRYLILNPWYVSLVISQGLHLRTFEPSGSSPVHELGYG